MFEKLVRVTIWLFAILHFLWIVASPTFFGAIIGGLIYNANQTKPFFIIGIVCVSIGFILGIIWAVNVWRKYGTIKYMRHPFSASDLYNNRTKKENGQL